jgi:hypothetical protein
MLPYFNPRRPRSKSKNNNEMNPEGTGYKDVDCIQLAQDKGDWRASMNTVMKFRVP